MLRICISGLSSSGKTTLGEAVSKDLKIMHVTKHKVDSFIKNETTIRKSLIQTAEKIHADLFDKEIAKLAEGNDCVVTTWLGPWMVKDATIKIWVEASLDERARRWSGMNKKSLQEGKAYIKEKDELTIKAFKELYNINVEDHDFFDMMINTERLNINEAVSLITMLALGKEKSRFR
jgi:predicted cytidylate kinase